MGGAVRDNFRGATLIRQLTPVDWRGLIGAARLASARGTFTARTISLANEIRTAFPAAAAPDESQDRS
ncbi:hypothetical protein [Bradyrhizobium sp. LTSPM299]|uniref:hypothetical protein n=1 Tax=Bradyrhizobium sp. LTSPM299 TaxID=1619233 RepID=UPI000678C6BD|nr:hypothetical protein [Bradyrhizobium sp. LTSPM299]